MRPLLLLAALSLFFACPTPPEKPAETPPSALPNELKPPTTLERSAGAGLPNDLKPPGR